MEFLHFYGIFLKIKTKNIHFIRNCQTKFVDLIEANNFAFLRFFRISHILVKKNEFSNFNSIFLN